MPEQFNVADYLSHLAGRWRVAVLACVAAGALALGFSLLLPKQYTSTASLLIEEPLGSDPRSSTVVSPIYLESLKTYEHLVQSDAVFLKAFEKFHLGADYPNASTESLKRRFLTVNKPRDTRILEVSVTLRDPRKAQAMVQYIAEQTVNLNRTLSVQSEQDLMTEGQRQLDAAREGLQASQNKLNDESARSPYDALQSEVDNLVELRARVHRELVESRVDIADYTSQNNQRELQSLRVRAAALEKQVSDIDAELASKEKQASARRAHLDQLGGDVKAARAAYLTAETRMNELRQAAGSRTERLRVIDSGIVPTRPSSPNIPLNVIAALFVAAIFTWLYLTITFALRGQTRRAPVRAYSAER